MKPTKTKTLALFGLFALLALVAAGCSSSEPAANSSSTSSAMSTDSNSAMSAETKPETKPDSTPTATPAAFTNDKGDIVCPVTGDTIASPDKAVGHQDYNGKRYYFCCPGCPDQFKADPAKFENGKALKKT